MKKTIIPFLFLSFALVCNSQIPSLNIFKSNQPQKQPQSHHPLAPQPRATIQPPLIYTLKVISENQKDMRVLADSIVFYAKRKYKFSKEFMQIDPLSNKVDSNTFQIKYVNVNDTTDYFNVLYLKVIRGENSAMEIKGKPFYLFYCAQGNFLDLFPFWNKFIDVKSDIERTSLQSSGVSKNLENGSFRFYPDEDNKWRINLR